MNKIIRLLSQALVGAWMFLPGRRRKVSAAYQRVLDPPPKGPSADRLRAAVRAPTAEAGHPAADANAVAEGPVSNYVASDQNRLPNSHPDAAREIYSN